MNPWRTGLGYEGSSSQALMNTSGATEELSADASAAALAARVASRTTARFSSIALRLVAVVLVTGILAFGVLGSLTSLRFNVALEEQATTLGRLSEQQLADRLDSEAQLARARLEGLGLEVATRLRHIAQRADITKAIETRNEVTIRELMNGITTTSGFDRILAFDQSGGILASDAYLSLVQIHGLIPSSNVYEPLLGVLAPDNSRSRPNGFENIQEFSDSLATALAFPRGQTVAHLAIEPVFEEFGDLIGALVAIRTLGRSETTLEKFSSIAKVGVVIVKQGEIVSSAGPTGVQFTQPERRSSGLIESDDRRHVARCVDYAASLKVCTFVDASLLTASRDQMFQIEAKQTRTMMNQFLLLAAVTLIALVIALLLVVRHTTRGLSALASAAKAVAHGDLHVKIPATGVGEVYSLSVAFDRMLTNLRKSMGRIEQLAYFDTVTALPNREQIRLAASDLLAKPCAGVFYFVDLDGFKSINDTFGHHYGDLLLKQVANRLVAHCKTLSLGCQEDKKIIGRLSGDEFVVILAHPETPEQAGHIARSIISCLSQPFDISGSQVRIGASVGITMFPGDGSTYETLLVNADLAMYAAKQAGRNGFAFYSSELADQAKKRVCLENDLKVAVQNKQLAVHYQPKVDCSSGQIRGVEALVRWKHPQFGYVSPVTFLGIAEEIKLINEIDLFVIRQSILDIGSLIGAGADLKLAVNVTAAEIENARFLDAIATIIEESNFPPSRFELEVTESVALQSPESVSRRLAPLRQLGVRFAIDDFGAGYSNLATLARLPIDTLKLDRALVRGVGQDSEKQSIVRVALGLAKELGLDSVAEGVESPDEYDYVVREGATMAQGYFCSPALPFCELVSFIGSYNLKACLVASDRASASETGNVISMKQSTRSRH
jgi:diguanylate cyclase (GGDEF)-like protein